MQQHRVMSGHLPPLAMLSAALTLLALPPMSMGQGFSVQAYKDYLQSTESLDAEGLRRTHDAGVFLAELSEAASLPLYHDSISLRYGLTAYEQSLLDRHGFFVTERLSPNSFGDAFMDIYTKDLPVYLSADAALHAIYMSYDLIW